MKLLRGGLGQLSLLIWSLPLFLLLCLPTLILLGSLGSLSWLLSPEAGGAREALSLSLTSSCWSTCITFVMGTPLAWLIAHNQNSGARIGVALLTIPLMLPPSIIGLTLLEATAQGGFLASIFPYFAKLPFSFTAVLLAQITVSAPLYILGAVSTFRQLDPELIEVARCLGLNPFQAWRRVALPLIAPSLLLALSLSTARALGEFGATLLFAGNLVGVTQTAPLAIYLELEKGTQGALALSLGLIGYALPILGALAFLSRGRPLKPLR